MPLPLADLRTRLSDAAALTFTLYGEGRGEPIEGRIAIGCVVRNRAHRAGQSVKTICLAHGQFSCWFPWGGQSNYEHLQSLVEASLKGGPPPWSLRERQVYHECAWIAEGLLSNFILDRVQGATHYYAPLAMKPAGKVPHWAKGLDPVVEVGRHLFFGGVDG